MTPAQLHHHLFLSKKLKISSMNLRCVSFDEIDYSLECFEAQIMTCLETITKNNKEVKLIFCSATLTDEEENKIQEKINLEIIRVSVPFNNLEGVTQYYYQLES